LRQMTSCAALVPERGNPLVTQIVFASKSVVIGGRGGPSGWQCGELCSAGSRQVVRAERHDAIRVGRIPVGIVDVGRKAVDVENLTSRKSCTVLHEWGIETHVQRVGLGDAVIGKPETAA